MTPLSKLTEILSGLPGIGPRHAERLAYFISNKNETFFEDIERSLEEVRSQRKRCSECRAVFYIKDPKVDNCELCRDKNRNYEQLIFTDTEIKRNSIERSGIFNGRYFILGKTIPITDTSPSRMPVDDMMDRIKRSSDKGLKEIILTFSYTPEGEHTAEIIKKTIKDICKERDIKISVPGRGFSAGTEVEYSDTDTLRHAFNNRTFK